MMKSVQSRIPQMSLGLILFFMSHFLVYAQKSTDTYQPTSMPTGFPTWQPASIQPLIDPVIMQNQQQDPGSTLPNDGSGRDPNMIPEPNWRKNPSPYQTEPTYSYPGPNYNNECRNNPYEGNQRSDYMCNNGCAPSNGYYSYGIRNSACSNDDSEWSYEPTNSCDYASNNNYCNRRDRGCGIYDCRECNRSRCSCNCGASLNNNRGCRYQGECSQATGCQNSVPPFPTTSCRPDRQSY